MNLLLYWRVWLKMIIFFKTMQANDTDVRSKLSHHLMSNHNPDVFPSQQNVTVYMWASIYHLIDVVGSRQEFTVLLWMRYHWIDHSLAWSRKQFNVTSVWLPLRRIWQPDIVVYNLMSFTDLMKSKSTSTYIKVEQDGKVFRPFPIIYTAACSLDISKFPFDKQICTITLGSWTMPAHIIDMQKNADSLETLNLATNKQWILTETKIIRNYEEYNQTPEGPLVGFVDIKFVFYVERQAMFYVFTLVVPSIIITFVALVGIFTPGQSDGVRVEKVTMGLTTMLTMAVFLLMVADQTPKDSTSLPLLSLYMMCNIGVVTSGTLLSVYGMTLQVHDLESKPVTEKWTMFLKSVLQGNSKIAPDYAKKVAAKSSSNKETDGEDKGKEGDDQRQSVEQPVNQWADVVFAIDKVALYIHFTIFIVSTIVMMVIIPLF